MKIEKINWNTVGRVAVFIDAANIIYSCRSLKWHIKYEKLSKYFQTNCKLVDIYFYYARREENDHDAKLLGALVGIGIKVKSREVKIFKNQDGTIQVKGNIDGELIVDTIRLKDQYDTAFLMSGDGDFRHAVGYLREVGKKIFIVSTRGHVAKDLIYVSNGYLNLRQFKDEWSFSQKIQPQREAGADELLK